jgi:uncharacterized protein YecE (DUF72 family)
MARLLAGTSGFAYPTWKPDFYPEDVPQKRFLNFYGSRLNAVEINYTFRRLPAAATLKNWVEATPEGFEFALKAHMKITHVLRLKNALASTELFLRAIDPLRCTRRLGPVLFQLAPNFKRDTSLLEDYLALLPRDLRAAFEFRHNSWLADDVYAVLERHNTCLCLAESEKLEIPNVITADFVYFRLRKPEYGDTELDDIGARAQEMVGGGRDTFVFFKHEETAAGALYAERVLRPRASAKAR